MRNDAQSLSGLELARYMRRKTLRDWALVAAICVSVGLWSAWGTNFNLLALIEGLPHIYNLGARMLPPDLEIIQNLGGPLIETLQMALLGTTIPIFFARRLKLVLLADEPIASLDVKMQHTIMELVSDLAKKDDITVVMSLHHLELAKQYASRIIGLSGGKVAFDGLPEELTDDVINRVFELVDGQVVGEADEE